MLTQVTFTRYKGETERRREKRKKNAESKHKAGKGSSQKEKGKKRIERRKYETQWLWNGKERLSDILHEFVVSQEVKYIDGQMI